VRKIEITVPDETYFGLVRLAESRGQDVVTVLRTVVRGLSLPNPVVELNLQGKTDKEIADATGLTLGVVADRRRKAGLKPNRWVRA
jgi:hypothetical protein